MPPEVRAVLATKCADCHSLEPRLPIYAHFAPASWIIERDVMRGRAAMNLSLWDHEAPEERQVMMRQIARVASQRKMPPAQYAALHWKARPTDTEIRMLANWGHSAVTVQAPQSDVPLQGDAGRGQVVFEKRCTGCHALDQNREGPRLRGVWGRTTGSVGGFDYSDPLKKSLIVWNEATLERWLADPDSMVPGTNMDFYVAKPGERADVIQFLRRHQSGK